MMHSLQWKLLGVTLLSAVAFGFLVPVQKALGPESPFLSDAEQYHLGAVHLLQDHMFSLDGVTPTLEREPGQSVWLAGIYALFGVKNALAVFAMQWVLLVLSVWALSLSLRAFVADRIIVIAALFMLLHPAVLHMVFSLNRESLALSLILLAVASAFMLAASGKSRFAILTGIFSGLLLLTYLPLLFLPVFLCAGLLLCRVRVRHIGIVLGISAVCLGLWGVRNQRAFGHFALSGPHRLTMVWYVRGEQAEHLRGLEPLACLRAEYLTRDWSGLPPECSFNYLKNTKWPSDIHDPAEDRVIAIEGQQKILQYMPWYLWFSLFEILELHLPFVDGWGHVYNVSVALVTVLLYLGCILSVGSWRRPEVWLLLLLIAQSIGIFILTDATPRYLIPILGAYAILAGIGYDWLLSRVWRRSPS